jgi:magnesium-protoporphyrin O-methyltransferase
MTTPSRKFCCEADVARLAYDGMNAQADVQRWHAGRLNPVTRELIDILRDQSVEGARILDIGGGVGAVHVALLEAGAAAAVDVDASREYLAAARAEAERRGLADRVDYRYGDVVMIGAELPAVDVATLDSVICCYPDLEALLAAATRTRPRLVGITYPRDVWWMRSFMRLYNLWSALRRSPARYFIHRHAQLQRWMAAAGYTNIHEGGIRVWRVVLYRRSEAAP